MSGYRVGVWKPGWPLYVCKTCGYSTLEEADIQQHCAKEHQPPRAPPPTARVLSLVDARGKPIVLADENDTES